MKRIFLHLGIFLILFLLLAGVSALTITGLITMEDEQFLDEAFEGGNLKEEYLNQINDNLDQVPDFVISIFGNERINVIVKMNDGNVRKYGGVTKFGRVAEIRNKFIEEPTMKVSVNESTIDRIRNSDDPVGEFVEALNSGEIKYEGIGVAEKAKETGIKAGALIYNIINGIVSFVANPFGIFG